MELGDHMEAGDSLYFGGKRTDSMTKSYILKYTLVFTGETQWLDKSVDCNTYEVSVFVIITSVP